MPKLNVLFMQSQEFFGADSMIHSLLMRYLDRNAVYVFVASNHGHEGARPASFEAIRDIPDVHHRSTQFGPSVFEKKSLQSAREIIGGSTGAGLSLAGLVAYCRRNKIHVIHCTEKPRDAFLGLLVARATGARCVIHVHVKAENWIRRPVRWAMGHANALIGVSQFVAESIVNLGYRRDATYAVHNALDLTRWNNQDDGKVDNVGWDYRGHGELRSEFGLGQHVPVLACVSRLIPWKGHRELIKALAIVKREVSDFCLMLVGEPTYGGAAYEAELRHLVAELELGNNVVFTGYRRDVPHIMATSDIYAMPSFEEPFGMVYLEAMAMRKPVIALDNGGAREIIEDNKSGLLSAPQDIEHLAANIVSLLKNPNLRDQMGRHGRHRVEDYFTPERMARDVQLVYEEILEKA